MHRGASASRYCQTLLQRHQRPPPPLAETSLQKGCCCPLRRGRECRVQRRLLPGSQCQPE